MFGRGRQADLADSMAFRQSKTATERPGSQTATASCRSAARRTLTWSPIPPARGNAAASRFRDQSPCAARPYRGCREVQYPPCHRRHRHDVHVRFGYRTGTGVLFTPHPTRSHCDDGQRTADVRAQLKEAAVGIPMLSSVLALLLLSFARQARPGWPWWRVWGRLGERRYQPDYFRFSVGPR